MMKTKLTLFVTVLAVSLFGGGCASASKNPLHGKIRADANRMINATAKGDYETVFQMTHPKAIEEAYKLAGGKSNALKKVHEMFQQAKQLGITWRFRTGRPSVAQNGNDYFAVVPITLFMTGQGQKVTTKSALIGTSSDSGKTWKYIGLDEQGEEGVRRFIPNIPATLKIPKHETLTK